jgi:hypothetical protein
VRTVVVALIATVVLCAQTLVAIKDALQLEKQEAAKFRP